MKGAVSVLKRYSWTIEFCDRSFTSEGNFVLGGKHGLIESQVFEVVGSTGESFGEVGQLLKEEVEEPKLVGV
jgi:hypothetical protein